MMIKIANRKKAFVAFIVDGILRIVTLPIRLMMRRSGLPKENINILVARLDHIGDVILSTPIYHSLKERYPGSRLTVLCASWSRAVLEHNPYLDEIVTIDCPWWGRIRSDSHRRSNFIVSYFRTFKHIKSRKFNVFIDLRGDLRQIFLFGWCTAIPIRISQARSGGS